MARPIIGASKIEISGSSNGQRRITLQAGVREPLLAKRLREKRSTLYVATFSKIDAGAYQSDQAALDSLLQTISSEFPELGIDQVPLGIVSRCFLGTPFEVHICDFHGEIVQHFEAYHSMSPPFERARSLALHRAYEFIEVFPDKLRAIAADGSVSVVGD
jgi:hypothetical protein